MELTINIPDIYFTDLKEHHIAKNIKLYTALMMYSSGKVSAGGACEIAEIDRYTFLKECKKHNIPAIDYNIDEIKKELQNYQTFSK